MANMLGLQDPMIIFCAPDMVSTIRELRSHATNRTMIIPTHLQDLQVVRNYPLDVWKAELEKDPERVLHGGYEVFWIWLSKTWLLMEAIKLNPFASTYFMWSDIGCFRTGDEKWKGQTMMQHTTDVLLPGRMLFMARQEPIPPPSVWWTNKKGQPLYFYHSGSMMVGTVETIATFHTVFLETLQGFLDRGLFIGDDQTILQCTCLQHPHLCAYIRHTEVPMDDEWFALRTVLRKGGNYTYWIPPSPSRSGNHGVGASGK